MKLLHKQHAQAIAYNLRVVAQQPSSIVRAATVLDGTDLTVGLKNVATDYKSLHEEMLKHSGIAVWKELGCKSAI